MVASSGNKLKCTVYPTISCLWLQGGRNLGRQLNACDFAISRYAIRGCSTRYTSQALAPARETQFDTSSLSIVAGPNMVLEFLSRARLVYSIEVTRRPGR